MALSSGMASSQAIRASLLRGCCNTRRLVMSPVTSSSDRTYKAFSTTTRLTTHPDVLLFENAVTEDEAKRLLQDCDKRLSSKKYQGNHYDSVIVDFKETEMPFKFWSKESLVVIKRLFTLAFEKAGLDPGTPHLSPHVIELKPKTGLIYPHVDSLKHGGEIVASLSLISTRTMRLTEPPKDFQVGTKLDLAGDTREKVEVDYVLSPRSFYVLTKAARYDLAHEIFKGDDRRVSIVFRDQPKDFMPDWAKDFLMGGPPNPT